MRASSEGATDTGEELRRRATSQVARRLVRLRAVVAPAIIAVGAFVAWADPAPWRRALVGVVPLILGAGAWYAAARLRRRGVEPSTLDANLAFNVVTQLLMVIGTGGVESPLAPTLVITGVLASLLGSARAAAALVGLQAAVVLGLAALQAGGALPSLLPSALARAPFTASSPALLGWRAATLAAFLGMTVVLGRYLRATLTDVVRETDEARGAQLDAHLEQHRALTTLTGEIAHELKNPLTTVKGLAALVARDVDGRTAERVAVLRREVERMEHTLEEFLNFSRPLAPLALERVDLAALSREVLALHEGVAAERGVRLALDAPAPAPVRCDPRKVRQVLVNVLQNALDAAPRGSTVTVAAACGPGAGARVAVRDEGGGVAPSVASRVFDAGVTTKPKGSGLGLTVARALARQHGGELALAPARGGGSVAEVTLPGAPGEAAA